MEIKEELRQKLRQMLTALNPRKREELSCLIAANLSQLKAFKEATGLLVFMSLPTEPKTDSLIQEALKEGRAVFAPRLQGEKLFFHRLYTCLDTPNLNHFGIREPNPCLPLFPHGLRDGARVLVLVPGLVFDRQKNRLGRGQGFYDRFLKDLPASYPEYSFVRIGLCFHFQLLKSIPCQAHDIPLDGIVTDCEILL